MSFGGKKYTGEITFTGEYFNGGILENTDGITAVILPNAKEIVNFNIALLVGFIAGVYSSIYISQNHLKRYRTILP